MKPISFTRPERQAIVGALRAHLASEFDLDMGDLAAEQLLDFLAETIGPHFYNRALSDAQTLIARRLEDVSDDLLSLERPVSTR